MIQVAAFALALAAVWGLAEGWHRLVPLAGSTFNERFGARAARLVGRMVIVASAVAVGIAAFEAPPVAVLLGAVAGWLAAAGRESRRPECTGGPAA